MTKTIEVKIWEIANRLPVFQKESQGFKFKYVNLEQIVRELRPLLDEYKLAYYHSTESTVTGNVLTTTVFQLDEQESISVHLKLPTEVKLAGMNDYQALGSGLTYFRRYNLITLFDILGADEDADGVTKNTKKVAVDYVEKVKKLIATGKYSPPQMEGWFNKNRGTMTDEQRVECKRLILNMTKDEKSK